MPSLKCWNLFKKFFICNPLCQGETESTNLAHKANIVALVQGRENQIFHKVVALGFNTLFVNIYYCQGELRCRLCHGLSLLPTWRPNLSCQVPFSKREQDVLTSRIRLILSFGCLHSLQVWELQLQQQRSAVWVGWGWRPWQQQHQQHQPGSVQRLQRTGGDTHPNRLDSSDISISSFYDNMYLIPGDLWDEELWRSISGTHIEVGATQEAYVSLLDSKL